MWIYIFHLNIKMKRRHNMPFSDTVESYLPLTSIGEATDKYKEYFEKDNITPDFIQDLVHREIIQARYFANALYVHPQMFEHWLLEHKNKEGRPFQNEGYMNKVDVRKYLEHTENYYLMSNKDVEVLFENNLLGTPVFLEKNTPYILQSKLNSFCEKDKLFNHADIVNEVKKYVKRNFGVISIPISDVLGFDIEKIGSLIYRGYIKPTYFSTSKVNNAYLVTEDVLSKCMNKLGLLIQENAKASRQKQVLDDFNFRFIRAIEQKAQIRNRLKPFSPPNRITRLKQRMKLQDKFNKIEELKSFLSSSVDDIDINTDFKEFMSEIKSLIPSNHSTAIYPNVSKVHMDKVSISFDKEIEMYEEALLHEKQAFR